MLYNININQLAIVELNKTLENKLDLYDCAIIEAIKSSITSTKTSKIIVNNEQYSYLTKSKIFEQLPLLCEKIGSNTVLRRRIKKIVEAKIFKEFIDISRGNQQYFAPDENLDSIIFISPEVQTLKSVPPNSKVCTSKLKSVNLQTLKSDNNIIDNNINNNIDNKEIFNSLDFNPNCKLEQFIIGNTEIVLEEINTYMKIINIELDLSNYKILQAQTKDEIRFETRFKLYLSKKYISNNL